MQAVFRNLLMQFDLKNPLMQAVFSNPRMQVVFSATRLCKAPRLLEEDLSVLDSTTSSRDRK
jgi:hypothetical protein